MHGMMPILIEWRLDPRANAACVCVCVCVWIKLVASIFSSSSSSPFFFSFIIFYFFSPRQHRSNFRLRVTEHVQHICDGFGKNRRQLVMWSISTLLSRSKLFLNNCSQQRVLRSRNTCAFLRCLLSFGVVSLVFSSSFFCEEGVGGGGGGGSSFFRCCWRVILRLVVFLCSDFVSGFCFFVVFWQEWKELLSSKLSFFVSVIDFVVCVVCFGRFSFCLT